MADSDQERILGELLSHQQHTQRQLDRIERAVEKMVSNHDNLVERVALLELWRAKQEGSWKVVAAIMGATMMLAGGAITLLVQRWLGLS